MKILDKYIIKQFIGTFLFTALIFTIIAIVIDYSDKIDDFIDEQVPYSLIIGEYYVNFILYMVGQLIPLYVLIAVIFFTSRLASNSEFISILNAGVPFWRILQPYIIAALIIAGFHLVSNHYLIPIGNKTRLDFENTYIYSGNDKGKKSNVHFFIGPDTKVYIRRFRKKSGVADNFQLETIRDHKVEYLLRAKKATWMPEEEKWKLKDFLIRTFDGMNETLTDGTGETMDTTLNLRPEDFVRFLNEKDMLVTSELKQNINRDLERGVGNTQEFEVEVQRRNSEPFSILILTIIGVAIASRKVRGGMGLHLLAGTIIGALYIFLIKFSITFANNAVLPAWLGVWLPNILFTGVAIYLVIRAQK